MASVKLKQSTDPYFKRNLCLFFEPKSLIEMAQSIM